MTVRQAAAVLLDLDPAYALQPRLRSAVDRVVALPPLPRWLCPAERARRALRALGPLPPSALVFLGSGDYHYLTALLLERIAIPFTLLLIDRHDDARDGAWGPDVLSCGGWVPQARRNPWLRQVVHVGDGPLPAPEDLRAAIPTRAVYVSVDKDALRPEDAATDWGEGSLALEELVRWLVAVGARWQVVGMDVCGECTPRLPACPTRAEREALARNERANLAFLAAWRAVTRRRRRPPARQAPRAA